MSSQSSTDSAATSRPRRGLGCIAVLVPGLVIVALTLPFSVPWIVWLNEARTCGRQPVIASKFAAGYSYTLPGDRDYQPGLFPVIMPVYFCTESEAQAQGFHRAPR